MALKKEIYLPDGSTPEYIRIYPLIIHKDQMTCHYQVFQSAELKDSGYEPVKNGIIPEFVFRYKLSDLEAKGMNPFKLAYAESIKSRLEQRQVIDKNGHAVFKEGQPVIEEVETNLLVNAESI